LKSKGWHVSGSDIDSQIPPRAIERGALDFSGSDPTADIVFVAVPASKVIGVVLEALQVAQSAVVTDVAGVKSMVASAISDPRFVVGHPLAGSEKDGIDGADPALFEGRAWVLTPSSDTDPQAYATAHGVITDLGARVLAMSASRHDSLVALVSHLPHLLAATLMTMAGEGAEESAEILYLAAGGFRDMTRVASGEPGIWPDVCVENSQAIIEVLGDLASRVSSLKLMLNSGDRGSILELLQDARRARSQLPTGTGKPEELAEVTVPIKDRPGALAEVTTLAAQLGINIEDVSISQSSPGSGGLLVMVVDKHCSGRLIGELEKRSFAPREETR
ncbi:MAG TPA: prephenate dehydrogenase/arogenate dehydrogenase family protein, partial [Acidimicrobiales bacterium]|nr:prephenate dehydrogenase/arogenate dehydrogenase family protein [Acidimicrobiales bacterium]